MKNYKFRIAYWEEGVIGYDDTGKYLPNRIKIRENELFLKPYLFCYFDHQLELPISDARIAFGVFGGRK